MSASRPVPSPGAGAAQADPDAAPTGPPPISDARRRAAAYLDLWERQLAYAAAEGDAAAGRPPRR